MRLVTALLFLSGFQTQAAYVQPPSIGVPVLSKGKQFNPDVSANLLGLYQSGDLSRDRNVSPHSGFSLQEAEVQFTSDIDVYFRGQAMFSLKQTAGAWGIDPEEVFLETISLPRVTVRVGKFFMGMGKHNQLHEHAFPFIDAPLINEQLFGDEGLNEVGVSAAVLLPTDWYSEIFLQGFQPSSNVFYNMSGGTGPDSNAPAGLVRWKNLLELSDSLTGELGLAGSMGRNEFDMTSSVYGADLTFKWRPTVGGKYQALIWSMEYLTADRKGFTDPTSGASTEKLGGLATWIQYQFAERWWVQGRYDTVGLSRSDAASQPKINRESFLVGFFPSEFTGLRAQYSLQSTEGASKTDHVFALQFNVSIGAHPAHAY